MTDKIHEFTTSKVYIYIYDTNSTSETWDNFLKWELLPLNKVAIGN